MHKNVLPLLFGFILLGALGHGAAQRVRGQDADAPAPAPARQANMPKQLRALDDAGALDAPRTGAIATLPVFIPDQDDRRIGVWAI